MHRFTEELRSFLRGELGQSGRVPLHEPLINGNEWTFVKECLDTGWLSSVGAFVDRFESDFANYVGSASAVVTVNGTAALHMALYVSGVRPGDLVISPTLTFVATANAITHCGGEPIFIDSSPETLGMCPDALRALLASCKVESRSLSYEGRRVAACVPVHIFGHDANIREIAAICSEYGIPLIEDSTEALGSSVDGRALGTFGRLGVFSFNGNKTITTGGGGMIVTNDVELGARVKHLTTTARVRDRWNFVHDEVGWNYRMPNINAALGCAQLESLPKTLDWKRALTRAYQQRIGRKDGWHFFDRSPVNSSNYWLNAVILDKPADRDIVLAECNEDGIEARPCWVLMHKLAPYSRSLRASALTGALDIESRLVNIPSSPHLGRLLVN